MQEFEKYCSRIEVQCTEKVKKKFGVIDLLKKSEIVTGFLDKEKDFVKGMVLNE